MEVNSNKRKGEPFSDMFTRGEAIKNWIEMSINNVTHLPIKTITFQVTESCNLNCSYCYEINKTNKKMDLDTAKKFIDLIVDESYKEDSYVYVGKTRGVILEFIGGEPLLEINLIHEIVDYFLYKTSTEKHIWAVNHMISMISNGVNYFDDRVQDLFKKYKNRISFSISLDGCKELHDACRVFYDGRGSYDIVERACKDFILNHNEYMSTKMTLAPENLGFLEQAFENLIDMGYKIINANPVYEVEWTEQHAKQYYKSLKKVADLLMKEENLDISVSIFKEYIGIPIPKEDNKNYCGTTGSMLSVDCNGDIYPCIRFMSISLGKDRTPYKIGDIINGIGRSDSDIKRVNLLDNINRKSQSTDECFNCPVASGCGWCTALNYQELGTPNKRLTNICLMHKARALANVYYWNNVYLKIGSKNKFKMHLSKEDAIKIINENEYDMLYKLQD